MTIKSKQHTVYKNKEGKRVPGTTTITGVMDKPALLAWANRIGLEGIKMREYVDDKADIGSLAHYLALNCHLGGEKIDTDDYSKNQISQAENALLKFFEWEKQNKIELIKISGVPMIEVPLVSEVHQYGGTCDLYCILNGVPTLIDLKTGKGIYPEAFTQVAAYQYLLQENGYPVEDVRMLRIGRDESEGFEDRKVPLLELHFKRFLICSELYQINKKLK